jgi:hypothetical protein
MCVKGLDENFPPEYGVAYQLNTGVFITSVVGVIGLGIPLISVAETDGTAMAFVAALMTLTGSSIVMCCGPQQRGADGRCQLIAAIVLNGFAAVLQFIALILIIWAWDLVQKQLAVAECGPSVTREECDEAIAQLGSIVAALLWTAFLYLLFAVGLEVYTIRAQLAAKRAMESAAAIAAANAPFHGPPGMSPPIEAYPVVTSTVVGMPPAYQTQYPAQGMPVQGTQMQASAPASNAGAAPPIAYAQGAPYEQHPPRPQ